MKPRPVQIRLNVAKSTYIDIKRYGFQVSPADVRTVHASQGEGWEAVIADLARPPRVKPEMFWLYIYVMLSRATSLEGFLALRLPRREDMNSRPPQFLLDEIRRLQALEQRSTDNLRRCFFFSNSD
eukprot:12412524-Karenia_brevis.AAC.1